MKFNQRISRILILGAIIGSFFITSCIWAYVPERVKILDSSFIVGENSTIRVNTDHYMGSMSYWCVEIDYGDGSPKEKGTCAPFSRDLDCDVLFDHTYTNDQPYTVNATSCDCGALSDCLSASRSLNPVAPPRCGDGNTDSHEECDDGNNVSGDGCDSNCYTESGPAGPAIPIGDNNPLNVSTFGELIFSIMNVIFYAGMILCPLSIIGGGVLMLMSASPNSIINGKKIILYSSVIFGIIIILKIMAYFFKGDLTFI
jgi:cysteine-rich repeat protein